MDSTFLEDHKQKVETRYPSMDRYQQPPSAYPCGPHHGYPYVFNSYPNNNTDFYPNQHYDKPLPEIDTDDDGSSSFVRLMLVLMIVLVASMCTMSLVMWFLFGTYAPEFEVTSLKVSNFTVTNLTLTSTWDVTVSVTNTNKDRAIQFDQVKSLLFYKEALLGVSDVKPFQVSQMQNTEFNLSLLVDVKNAEENRVQEGILPTLEQDYSNGMVDFSLRLALKANFTMPNMAYRQESMKVMCERMEVVFSADTGAGRLSPPGMMSTCLIQVQ
ncbi:late embryogenesis abundant protein [Striga asiatica]|uniref:Late embryogenesis abundant protein n=1 Tax=Striga asiatica TaxID=4170 RepID=A0A5A7Q9D0_STRAF|nr:late embryogenesis abundant protein [Striga asiatica]